MEAAPKRCIVVVDNNKYAIGNVNSADDTHGINIVRKAAAIDIIPEQLANV